MTDYTPLPGPKPDPILGSRKSFNSFDDDAIGFLSMLHKTHGEVTSFVETKDTGKLPLFVCGFGPRVNEIVLGDENRFQDASRALNPTLVKEPIFAQVLGLSSPTRTRDFLQDAFDETQLDAFLVDWVRITNEMLESWHPFRTSQEPIDVAGEARKLSEKIATKTIFGVDDKDDRNIGALLSDAQKRLGGSKMSGVSNQFPFTSFGKTKKLVQVAIDASKKIVAERRAQLEREASQPADTQTRSEIVRQTHLLRRTQPQPQVFFEKRLPVAPDGVSALILARADGSQLNDDDIVSLVVGLYKQMREASASALTWTLFLLSQHPNVLNSLGEEVTSPLRGATPTIEQLGQLRLLDNIVKESLRLFPPKPYGARQAMDDFDIGDFHLPKGAIVYFSPFETHRIAAIYDKPLKFLPHRFNHYTPATYEYLPLCGEVSASASLRFVSKFVKLVLAMLLQRYRMATVRGANVSRISSGTLLPLNGLPMFIVSERAVFPLNLARGNVHEMVELPKK
jgi:cytochrome P450